jgi:LPS sulfotransferase NodH
MTRPNKSYLVAATPRSGSTLLCELLSSTGIAGRPAEHFEDLRATGRPRQPREYFTDVQDPAVVRLLAPSEPGAPIAPDGFRTRYETALAEGTTPNGVFATKVMWGYLPDLLAGLRELPHAARRRPAEALAAAFPGLRYVQVLREDKVAQAVSLWTAVQTAQWRDDGEGPAHHEPEYSFWGIHHLVEQLTAQERAWTRWFARAGIAPVTVVYEELAGAPREVAREVLSALDLEPADPPQARMRRQSSGRSLEWAERYRLEVADGRQRAEAVA